MIVATLRITSMSTSQRYASRWRSALTSFGPGLVFDRLIAPHSKHAIVVHDGGAAAVTYPTSAIYFWRSRPRQRGRLLSF
jgi:hypothetical protein